VLPSMGESRWPARDVGDDLFHRLIAVCPGTGSPTSRGALAQGSTLSPTATTRTRAARTGGGADHEASLVGEVEGEVVSPRRLTVSEHHGNQHRRGGTATIARAAKPPFGPLKKGPS